MCFRALCVFISSMMIFLTFDYVLSNNDDATWDDGPNVTYSVLINQQPYINSKEVDGWWNNIEPPVPMDINKPLPQPKVCVEDVNKFLRIIRSSQRKTVKRWYNLRVSDEIKWAALPAAYDPKAEIIRSDIFHVLSMKGETEAKYFIDFVERAEPLCNIYSIGIGLDYSDAFAIWQRYPQCAMTAVDPVSKGNRDLVQLVPGARFFEYAIGATDEEVTSLIMKNGVYGYHKANHTDIVKFFKKANGKKLIDLLIIDVEGAEFKFLDKFVVEKHHLPTICQLNIELHPPNDMYGYEFPEALEKLYKFLSDGTYSIFNMDMFRRFVRIYLVNTANPQCTKKLFCQTQETVE